MGFWSKVSDRPVWQCPDVNNATEDKGWKGTTETSHWHFQLNFILMKHTRVHALTWWQSKPPNHDWQNKKNIPTIYVDWHSVLPPAHSRRASPFPNSATEGLLTQSPWATAVASIIKAVLSPAYLAITEVFVQQCSAGNNKSQRLMLGPETYLLIAQWGVWFDVSSSHVA